MSNKWRERTGANIRRLRKAAGCTQESLAEKMGLVHCTVGTWERGEKMPRLEHVKMLMEIFGVELHDIVQFDE